MAILNRQVVVSLRVPQVHVAANVVKDATVNMIASAIVEH
jgi:hypothetical protein